MIELGKYFADMKREVIEKPILALPNFDNLLQVDFDASGIAIVEIFS